MIQLPWAKASPKRVVVPKLNLYPEDPFNTTVVGKSLRWAVSVGRHIIIFTELVVIGSFASRFVLDRQLTDLNASILQKQAIVESYGDLEKNVRELQQQSSDVRSILAQQGKLGILDILQSVTPVDVSFRQVSFFNDKLVLEGRAISNSGLSLLVDALQNHPSFERVTMGQIESGDARDPNLSFTMSLQYRVAGTASPAPKTAPKSSAKEPAL